MYLIAAESFDAVRQKYLDVIEHTLQMQTYARWDYGRHPTDEILQRYIDYHQMYVLMDGEKIAGMVAVTMEQGEDYHAIGWPQTLRDDEAAVLHILAICPEYQHKHLGKSLVLETIELAKEQGKAAMRLDALSSNVPA